LLKGRAAAPIAPDIGPDINPDHPILVPGRIVEYVGHRWGHTSQTVTESKAKGATELAAAVIQRIDSGSD
jgi:hypothetical protein